MQIEFDTEKSQSNQDKHRVPLGAAESIEWDTLWAKPDDRQDYGEERMIGSPISACAFTAWSMSIEQNHVESSVCEKQIQERLKAMPTLKHGTIVPATKENAEIQHGIQLDQDTYELSPAEFAQLQPARRRGRPPLTNPKKHINIRIPPEVLQFFQKSGAHYQTEINKVLREWVKAHK